MKSPYPPSSGNNLQHISLRNVIKRYGPKTILAIDKFDIDSGDAIFLYGENGGGKTTLIRILAGTITVSKGTVTRSKESREFNTVYIPQNGGLYRQMTVKENFQIWAHLYRQTFGNDIEKQWVVQKLGIEKYLETKVRELSGGLFKLVAIACGISVNPQALMLDEPFSGVDEKNRDLLDSAFEDLQGDLEFFVLTGHRPTNRISMNKQIRLSRGSISND